MDYLESLNDRQKEAAVHINGPLLIIAGAGAGKTKTVTHRIVNLIKNGVNPRNILAVTFTNKAASEMSERVTNLINKFSSSSNYSGRPWLGTFHSLGVNILRTNGSAIGISKYFSILDKDESLSLIKKVMKENGIDPKNFSPKTIQGLISKHKNNLKQHSDYEKDESESYIKSIALQTWKGYEKKLAEQKSLDFDDLILKTVTLFKTHPEILNFYQSLWQYIHIDEYQDTNTAQYELSRLLAEKHKNICVVGDSDQAVYGWRNADFRNILNFETNFPGTKVVLLEQNYRSTKNIIEAANQIIAQNKQRKEKRLFTENETGEKISLFCASDQNEEASFVVKKIKELKNSGSKPDQIAILYRTNFQSRALEEACIRNDVAYHLLGTKFYDRKEIKDTLSFIKLALNPEDKISLERIINVPPRGIGKATLDKILENKEGQLPLKTREKIRDFKIILEKIKKHLLENKLSESIKFIVKTTGMEGDLKNSSDEEVDRLENLKELANLASRYDDFVPEEAVEKFITDTSLLSDQDSLTSKATGIRLMTVHASKGLEFDNVFVTGLEQDLFPHKRQDFNSETDTEEERRLFYVAITRARKGLWLTYCQTRQVFGSTEFRMPSEFLADISDDLVNFEESKQSSFSRPKLHFNFDEPGDDIVWEVLSRPKK